MKRNHLFLLVALVTVLLLIYYYWPCYDCWFRNEFKKKTESGYHCTGVKMIGVRTLKDSTLVKVINTMQQDTAGSPKTYDSDKLDSVQVPYVCNQLIFAPELAGDEVNKDKMRKYLGCQGFQKDRTCACSDKLELWTYQDAGDANLIEVVKDPPKDNDGNHIGGLSLNYEIAIDDRPDPGYRSKDENPNGEDSIPAQMDDKNKKEVIVGVSDSGVDLDNDSPLMVNNYLWDESMTTSPLCIDPGNYGLSKLSPNIQPTDINGHGTFVNGIIIGAAKRSNFPPQPPVSGLNFRVLNIKNSDASSFSIFDAICGLYFGAQQNVRLFNISWGVLEENNTEAPKIFQLFLDDNPEVVLVAGMGNNGVSLDKNARFWPACMAETQDRVISVGALNENCTWLAGFSNYSFYAPKRMTMLAPGENIVSLIPKSVQSAQQDSGNPPSGRAIGSGTSYATPFVTRRVAVLHSANPDAAALKPELVNSASGFKIGGKPALH